MQDLNDAMTCLGYNIGEEVTYDALKKRWKELCQKHHPDKPGGNPEEFRKVTHAFKMLTDADYRQKERERAARRPGGANNFGALDIRMVLPISFDDAFFGRALHISYAIFRIDEDSKIVPLVDGDRLEIERLTIDLPPGIPDGHQELIPGRGHRRGTERGNILAVIQVLPHGAFQLREGNIHANATIPLDLCLKGGKIDVLTMYGLKPLKVKAGTKPGDVLKMPGLGCHKAMGFGLQSKGDHFVTINVDFPSREDLREKTVWQRLEIDWQEDDKEDKEAEDFLRIFATVSSTTTFKGF